MPHDLHFLERLSRVSEEDQALALSLYQDPELTRIMLELATLPEQAERVALAMWPRPEGPHIIVNRKGIFVTCLGPGMTTDPWPVLSRHQVEGLRVRAQRQLEALSLIKPGRVESTAEILNRFTGSGPGASREDFEVAAALLPIMSTEYLRGALLASQKRLDTLSTLRQYARSKSPPKSPNARKLERLHYLASWTFAQYLTLVALAPNLLDQFNRKQMLDFHPVFFGYLTGQYAIYLRSVWCLAQLGQRFFDTAREWWRSAPDGLEYLCALISLTAIGCRHPKLRSEVRSLLLKAPPVDLTEDEKSTFVQLAFDALDNADSRCLDARVEESARRFSPHDEEAQQLTRMSFKFQFGCPEKVIDDVTLLTEHLPKFSLLTSFSARDFFLPRAFIPEFVSKPDAEYLHRLARAQVDICPLVATRENVSATGRNDPCPCNSGKKFKHCCGCGH